MQDGYSAYSSIFQLYQQEQEQEEEAEEAEKSQQQMTVSGKSMQTATRVTEKEAHSLCEGEDDRQCQHAVTLLLKIVFLILPRTAGSHTPPYSHPLITHSLADSLAHPFGIWQRREQLNSAICNGKVRPTWLSRSRSFRLGLPAGLAFIFHSQMLFALFLSLSRIAEANAAV